MSVRGILENTEDNGVYHEEDIWITKISVPHCSALMETHSGERNTRSGLELSAFCRELFHWGGCHHHCLFPSHLSHLTLPHPSSVEAVPRDRHKGSTPEPSSSTPALQVNGSIFLHCPMFGPKAEYFLHTSTWWPKQTRLCQYSILLHLRSVHKHPKALYLHRWLPYRDFLSLDWDFSPHFSCGSITSVIFTS